MMRFSGNKCANLTCSSYYSLAIMTLTDFITESIFGNKLIRLQAAVLSYAQGQIYREVKVEGKVV